MILFFGMLGGLFIGLAAVAVWWALSTFGLVVRLTEDQTSAVLVLGMILGMLATTAVLVCVHWWASKQ